MGAIFHVWAPHFPIFFMSVGCRKVNCTRSNESREARREAAWVDVVSSGELSREKKYERKQALDPTLRRSEHLLTQIEQPPPLWHLAIMGSPWWTNHEKVMCAGRGQTQKTTWNLGLFGKHFWPSASTYYILVGQSTFFFFSFFSHFCSWLNKLSLLRSRSHGNKPRVLFFLSSLPAFLP